MLDYMLGDLIYFRKLLISITTRHLSCKDVINRIAENENLHIYLDDLKQNDPNIRKIILNIETSINKLCNHVPVIDWIDDVVGDNVIKICYCSICELNMENIKHDHCC